ncbi:hypothetical protein SteCoe_24723 [Stentor coeruleus]|uniref:Uncharacterized protein n=1 Tax=Stentor coeruleus TaxID=5963 RepID=A0A1R2BGX2_9CILI|nr:hypothetical protein SteCoe_24723 [Stentor coeruleus]
MGCSPSNTKVAQDQNDPYIQVTINEKLPPQVFEAFKSFHNQASQVHQRSIKISAKTNAADILINHTEGENKDKNHTDHLNANDLNGKNSITNAKSGKDLNCDKHNLQGHMEKNSKNSLHNNIDSQKDANKDVLSEKNQMPEPEEENSLKINNGPRQLPPIDLYSSRNKKFIID